MNRTQRSHDFGKRLRALVLTCVAAACLLLPVSARAADDPIPPEKLRVMVEALARLNHAQIEANPKLQVALARALAAARGTADFVRLVKALNLPDQTEGLLEVVRSEVPPDVSVEAIRVVLASQAGSSMSEVLIREQAPGILKLVEALGNCQDRRAVPLLLAVLKQANRDAVVRRATVRGLTRTQDGAAAVLALAREGGLPEDVRFVAATEMGSVRWQAIKSEATKVFPPLAMQGAETLPPVVELMRRAGDAVRGAAVFRRDTVGCIRCHQVNGEGTDFGPRLSEIGSKLGKDALYESVLDPSAGISFGFEAWLVNLKDGDEVFGLVVSEAEDEIVMKAQGGVVTRCKKADIASREKQTCSIMPAGLQAAMSVQELVDLVEYLSTLRTPGK